MVSLTLEAYGKAVVVKGDTKPVKAFLSREGGRWNSKVGGWIFKGSVKAPLLAGLRALGPVSSVVDKTALAATPVASTSDGPAGSAPTRSVGPDGPDGADGGDASGEPPAKRAKLDDASAGAAALPADSTAAETGESGELVIDLGSLGRCSISSYKGRAGADLRKFYKDQESGEVRPTPKGIRLSPTEWASLLALAATIERKLKKASSSSAKAPLEVAGDVFVQVEGGAGGFVDIRRFYRDKESGEQLPGKKGVRLGVAQWAALQEAAPRITMSLGNPAPPMAAAATAPDTEADAEADDALRPSSTRLRKKLRKLLRGRDLAGLSLRAVRAELEVAFGLEESALDCRKGEVKGMVMDILENNES